MAAALCTIARAWKHPKYPQTDKWIKMWYKHTMECYSDIKGTKRAICRDVDRPREGPTERSKSEEKNECHILTPICRMQKNGADESIAKQRQRQNRHADTKGYEWGWDGLGDRE